MGAAGTPDEAIEFGEVILLSISFMDLPEFGRTRRAALGEKTVLETTNPFPSAMLPWPRMSGSRGTGRDCTCGSGCLGVRIVRAFNSVWDQTLAKRAHCVGHDV